MTQRIDLTGKKLGRWTVKQYVGGKGSKWTCVCECGYEKDVAGQTLRNGMSTGCRACMGRDSRVETRTTELLHFARHTGMIQRCREGKTYLDKGITVCDEWQDVRVFNQWLIDNLGPCPEGYTLDRIDNHGNYEPGNVRWADRVTQYHNRG